MQISLSGLWLAIGFFATQYGSAGEREWDRIAEIEPVLQLTDEEIAAIDERIRYKRRGWHTDMLLPDDAETMDRLANTWYEREMTPEQATAMLNMVHTIKSWKRPIGPEVPKLLMGVKNQLEDWVAEQNFKQLSPDVRERLLARKAAE